MGKVLDFVAAVGPKESAFIVVAKRESFVLDNLIGQDNGERRGSCLLCTCIRVAVYGFESSKTRDVFVFVAELTTYDFCVG